MGLTVGLILIEGRELSLTLSPEANLAFMKWMLWDFSLELYGQCVKMFPLLQALRIIMSMALVTFNGVWEALLLPLPYLK
jgi:hypothetical protein